MDLEPNRATPPQGVDRPVMLQRWDSLSFIHWRYRPAEVQKLLPPGLEVDTFDGDAWVGLVPFDMQDIRPPRFPKGIPWIGTFPETNIRTYVVGPDGRRGVYFNSLDITRVAAVAVARIWYRLPYNWASMSVGRDGDAITYKGRRRWPRDGAASSAALTIGDAIEEPSQLELFLTARWGLWTVLRDRLAYAAVDHPPWPLHRAELTHLTESLTAAAGLEPPSGEPLVHYSPGVDVRIGRPRRHA